MRDLNRTERKKETKYESCRSDEFQFISWGEGSMRSVTEENRNRRLPDIDWFSPVPAAGYELV